MDNLFVWEISSVISENFVYSSILEPNTDTTLFTANLYHFYYYGVEQIGLYLIDSKATRTLLNWANSTDKGLRVTIGSTTTYFKVDSGDKIDTPIILYTGLLGPEEKLSISIGVSVPEELVSSNIFNFEFGLVYQKRLL